VTAPTPVYGHRSAAANAEVREVDGRSVSWFSLDGGKHRGAIGTPEGETIVRAVHLAVELGMPIVGRLASSGADVSEGVSALHAWGTVAKALADASGVVPVVLVLVGPAVSGPALL
jgi:acetyl-CoA carboxylase carboxyltransferase component